MDKLKKSDIIWNYLGTAFKMGINFLILPFLLIFLKSDILGLWYVMASLASIADLFTFGCNPAFARNIAYSWNGAAELCKEGKADQQVVTGKVNYKLLNEVLVTSKRIYLIISITAVFLLSTFGSLYIVKVSESIINSEVIISWIIMLAAIFTNLYYGYYTSFLIGIGKIKESNQILVVACVLRITVMGIAMLLGLGLIGATLAYFVNGLVVRCLSKAAFFNSKELKSKKKEMKTNKVSSHQISECFKIVWFNAWRDGVVSAGQYLQTQASTIVCSFFLNLSEVAMYSLTIQLVKAVADISRSIFNAYTPVFQSSYIRDEYTNRSESVAFCVFLFSLLYIIGICAVLIVGIPIIRLIKPDVELSKIVLIGFAVYYYQFYSRTNYCMYLSCTTRDIYWKSNIVTALLTVAAYSLAMLMTDLGVWAIIFVSVLFEALYNSWKWPMMVKKELGLSVGSIIIIGMKKTKDFLLGSQNK